MFPKDIKDQIQSELEQALKAQTVLNMGKARVCARRAVGIALRACSEDAETTSPNTNTLVLLQELEQNQNFPESMREIAGHLLQRVNSDYSHPLSVDLVAEAKWLIEHLEQNCYGGQSEH